MDRKFVESLGWEYVDLWANREFFHYGNFTIMEHNCSWSVVKGGDNYFIEGLDEEMLTEYTNLIKDYYKVCNDPENHTLAEYWKAVEGIGKFCKKYGYNEEEEFDL